MSLFPNQAESSLYLSMNDASELLSRNSPHSIKLDGHEWPSVEHYFQAMQFENTAYQEKIRSSESIEQAVKLGKAWFKKKRADLKQVRTVLMTRAIYIKCRTHPEVSNRLLEIKEETLVENSQFDYFWGCGRDHRGNNHYGKVLMDVRKKLISEQQNN